jgi:chromosome segregation ATPase
MEYKIGNEGLGGPISHLRTFGSFLKRTVHELWVKFTRMLSGTMAKIKSKLVRDKVNNTTNTINEPNKDEIITHLDAIVREKESELAQLRSQLSDFTSKSNSQIADLTSENNSLKSDNENKSNSLNEILIQNRKLDADRRRSDAERQHIETQYKKLYSELRETREKLDQIKNNRAISANSKPQQPSTGNSYVKYSAQESEEYYELVDEADTE